MSIVCPDKEEKVDDLKRLLWKRGGIEAPVVLYTLMNVQL